MCLSGTSKHLSPGQYPNRHLPLHQNGFGLCPLSPNYPDQMRKLPPVHFQQCLVFPGLPVIYYPRGVRSHFQAGLRLQAGQLQSTPEYPRPGQRRRPGPFLPALANGLTLNTFLPRTRSLQLRRCHNPGRRKFLRLFQDRVDILHPACPDLS